LKKTSSFEKSLVLIALLFVLNDDIGKAR